MRTIDILTDFVQRTHAELEAREVAQREAEQRARERSQAEADRSRVSEKLQQAIADASRRGDLGLKALLERVQKALEPGVPRDAALMEALKNPEHMDADSFGAPREAIPPVLKEALAYFERYRVPDTSSAARPDLPPPEVESPGHTESPTAPANDPARTSASAQAPRPPAPDDVARRFVSQYFTERFEDPSTRLPPFRQAPATAEVARAPELPAFEAMSPEEQHFVLTADDRQMAVYARLPPDLRTVYREFRPEHRGEFLKLSADEKTFVRQLDPADRHFFLSLNPDHRAKVRQMSPEQRSAWFGELKAQQAQLQNQPPEKAARALGETLLRDLGVPLREGSPLLEQARALAFNYLQQSKGDLIAAQTGTLKALLNLPEVQQEVERAVMASVSADTGTVPKGSGQAQGGAAGVPQRPTADYLGHLQRVRHVLPEFAQRMVQPGLSREQLVEGLKKAVIVSADFAHAYPPRQFDDRADPVRRGLRSRALRG